MTHDIYHNLKIKHSAEKIYEAITSSGHLEKWWPLRCSGQPELGEQYNFFFTEEYDWYGKVVQLERNKAFHIEMTRSDDDWDKTTFGFDLKKDGNAVLVQFSHRGWSERNDHYKRTSYCWALLLHGLKNYVEKDIIIPFSDRA